ncbi:MAG: DUF805 domain-containing protein [Pseudomonadota bacterium]
MTFQQSISTCLRKYFTFSGRASRSEYWWFFLFVLVLGIILGLVEDQLFGTDNFNAETTETSVRVTAETNGPLTSIFSLLTFLPMLAAGWRRMHDTGRSGLFLLYPLIVMVGLMMFIGVSGGIEQMMAGGGAAMLFDSAFGLILLVAMFVLCLSPFLVLWWLTRPSQPGQNQFGPNPHEVQQ